jgi:hypothetical protein
MRLKRRKIRITRLIHRHIEEESVFGEAASGVCEETGK